MKKKKQCLNNQIIQTARVRQRNISIMGDNQILNQKSDKKSLSQKKVSNIKFKSQKKENTFSTKQIASIFGTNPHQKVQSMIKSINQQQNNSIMKQYPKKNIDVNKLKLQKQSGTKKSQMKILKIIHVSNKKNKTKNYQDNLKNFEESPIKQKKFQLDLIQHKLHQEKMPFIQQIPQQFTEEQTKKISTQLTLIKFHIFQKIAEKRNANDIDVQTLIQDMNDILNVQFQKIIQKTLQNRKSNKINQINSRQIKNQTHKSQNKIYQKKQISIKEFSLFQNKEQNLNEIDSSNQNLNSILQKVQLPDGLNLKKTSVKEKDHYIYPILTLQNNQQVCIKKEK